MGIKNKYVRLGVILVIVLLVFYFPFSWINPFYCFTSLGIIFRSLLIVFMMGLFIIYEWRKIVLLKKTITLIESFLLAAFLSSIFKYISLALIELIGVTNFSVILVFLWYPIFIMYVILSCISVSYILNKEKSNR